MLRVHLGQLLISLGRRDKMPNPHTSFANRLAPSNRRLRAPRQCARIAAHRAEAVLGLREHKWTSFQANRSIGTSHTAAVQVYDRRLDANDARFFFISRQSYLQDVQPHTRQGRALRLAFDLEPFVKMTVFSDSKRERNHNVSAVLGATGLC